MDITETNSIQREAARRREKQAREIIRHALGPAAQYLDATDVEEVMVNAPDEVFIESRGVMRKLDGVRLDPVRLQSAINQIAALADKSRSNADENRVSTMLITASWDQMRLAAALPPIATRGPMLCIRKGSNRFFSDDEYHALGFFSIPEELRDEEELVHYEAGAADGGVPLQQYLKMAVLANKKIMLSGATSSGKTAFLNRLASYIPPHERTAILEDTKELAPQLTNWIGLESNDEKGVGLADLGAFSLRARPNRVIYGEVRKPLDCMELIRAFNTGHGGFGTVHAGSGLATLTRLETLLLRSGGDSQLLAARAEIATAIDLIVHITVAHVGAAHRRQRFIGQVILVGDSLDPVSGAYDLRTIYDWRDALSRRAAAAKVGRPTRSASAVDTASNARTERVDRSDKAVRAQTKVTPLPVTSHTQPAGQPATLQALGAHHA